MMKRSDIKIIPPYYQRYSDLAPDEELKDVFDTGGIGLYEQNADKLQRIGQNVYAEGKWTVNEIIEHLIDTERIFANRALRFIRNDNTSLPSFDQDYFADQMRSNDRSLSNLLNEYKTVRKSNTFMFEHLNDEELQRNGTVGGEKISVLAIGFVLIGHPIHHFRVIRERYFPLINN